MEFEPNIINQNFDESIGIRESVEKYSRYFKWFVLGVAICVVLAFFKLRYTVPTYNVSATILIKEKEKGNSISNISGFEDLGLFSSGDNTLENEIEIIRSRRLMTKVVEELKLNVRYFIEDSPLDQEVYPNFPIVLEFLSDSATISRISTNFSVHVLTENTFEFFDFDDNFLGVFAFGEKLYANLGNEEKLDERTIRIVSNPDFEEELIGERIKVKVSTVSGTADYLLAGLSLEPVDQRFSKVLKMSIKPTVIGKGIAILNNLIEQYNADGINDKDLIARATTNFLDDRLILISNELQAIEATAAQFKTNRGMIDSGTGADIYIESSTMTESEMVGASTQLQLVNYMLDELSNSRFDDLLPGNIGLSDPAIINMINEYNDLVLQRNRVLKSSSEKNPIIVNIDSQLQVIRNNLIGSLKSLQSSAQIQIDALSKKSGKISSKIASVPKFEKEYKDIIRDQETKNALYLFLLQKREESILSNAVKIEKAKIIDPAFSNGQKVTPKALLTYFGALVLGLMIPFVIIYIQDILDTKVHDEKDLEKLRIPFLGDVPFAHSKKNLFIEDGDNSAIAESFRYIRTNINFMLDVKNSGRIVFVTSTIAGEGKTFTAINLSNSLAISGKKTVLVGLDLRAPRVHQYLREKNQHLGVTNYIKDDSITISEITNKSKNFSNLDIINSGNIPPNPVEMLMSKRVKDLLEHLRQEYEYVIVDTAPVGMVTDTIQIAKYADLTIYVIKANSLDKRMLHIPEKLNKEKKLMNMALLINASDHTQSTYGYGYGYSYGRNKNRAWYKRIFDSAAI